MAVRRVSAVEKETVNLEASKIMVGAMIRIKTAGALGAGTNANVKLTIGGESKNIDNPNKDDFERNCDDLYSIYPLVVDRAIGALRTAVIELYQDGSGNYSDWKIDKVWLYVLPQGSYRWLIYKQWNSVGWLNGDHDGRTVRLQ